MSNEAPDVDIDSILMPPPRKRPRDGSKRLAKDIEFSLPMPTSQNHVLPTPSTDHSRSNAGLDGAASVPIMAGISHYEDGVAFLPEVVNFVTPPKTEACFHDATSTTVEDRDATDFSETDSVQTEHSTVIDESCSEGNGNQELGLEDAQPETTSTRFSDVIGHASVKLRIDEMLLPLALPPALAQSILTGMFLYSMLSYLKHG
jgi:hypothetical protein